MTALTELGREPPPLAASAAIRLAVVDLRRLIAEALGQLLAATPDFAVTGVHRCDRSLTLIAADAPDLVLVGCGVGCAEALGFVGLLRAEAPDLQVVLLADVVERELVRFVLAQRLQGLLLTDAPAPELVAALRQIAHGQTILPPGWQRALDGGEDGGLGSLSERQMEVLRLLAEGCSYQQIGGRLFISQNTVKFHVRSIFSRLRVNNRMAAAWLLAEHGTPPSRSR